MAGFHRPYGDAIAEELVFPGQITQRVLIPGAATGGTFAVFEDVVHPGIGPPRHIHHQQDETFLVEEGDFVFELAGSRIKAAPGDATFIPKGTVHAFRNMGNTPGRLRFIFNPALEVEAMFRAFHAAAQGRGLSAEKMSEIAARNGQETVGPPLEP